MNKFETLKKLGFIYESTSVEDKIYMYESKNSNLKLHGTLAERFRD